LATLDDQLLTNNGDSTQARAFTASELVPCPSCSRANPPTRANCLYCGAGLGISVEASPTDLSYPPAQAGGPDFAALTAPEKGTAEDVVHVVTLPGGSDGSEVSAETARLLNLAPPELNSLLSARVAPLYATTATAQAQEISDKLRSAGVEPLTVSDAQLNLAEPPKQIGALAMNDDALTASVRRVAERVSVAWSDVVLIVLGRLYFTTIEVEQKRDKSKQVLDERQLTTDEAVLDIYSRADQTGWRIRAGSFDFSCLGAEKKPVAFENFRTLADVLQRNGPHAVCDDSYVRMRVALNKVWPPQARAGASERRRTLTRSINATTTISDNELQFTRYSRLLRFLAPQLQNDAQQS
jgi:hypothetical protein